MSAWYGGLGPGLLATALSALGSVVFFLPPVFTFAITQAGGVLRVGLFLLEGVVISALSGALHQERRRAEQALKARDEFLRVAAHELKNPLTGLSGYAQLLSRRAPQLGLNERDQRGIASIGEQARRLNRLVDRLLDISRIEGGGLEVERRPIELVALVRTQVEQLIPTLQRHTLAFAPPQGHVWVLGDALRLEQVLHNLLQNAVRYSPAGGTITVSLSTTAARAVLMVRDEGIGIPASQLRHIFERNARVASAATRSSKGLGLGLTIVRALVEAHQGTVAVASTEGAGSTFTVTLPLHRQLLEHKAPEPLQELVEH